VPRRSVTGGFTDHLRRYARLCAGHLDNIGTGVAFLIGMAGKSPAMTASACGVGTLPRGENALSIVPEKIREQHAARTTPPC
jgi:hypothetical protein